MQLEMGHHVVTLGKRFATLGTFVILFAGVGEHVLVQLGRCLEAKRTQLALFLALFGVGGLKVHPQRGLVHELFATFVALVELFAGLELMMVVLFFY